MPKPLALDLEPETRRTLEAMRDRHPRPHLREKAGALLKIADGASGRQVADLGLLKPRKPDTVYGWVRRFLEEGIAGLQVRAGRGRKPAFSPSVRG